jgi:hypothetical protein
MGTNEDNISLEAFDDIIPKKPRLALTNSYLFCTFPDNGRLVLIWGELDALGGLGAVSDDIALFEIGDILELKIIARDNIVLAAAIERVDSIRRVRAAVGRVSEGVFNHLECPMRDLPEGQIVDILSRINEDGTSDDLVCIKPGGASTGVYGHHPAPP